MCIYFVFQSEKYINYMIHSTIYVEDKEFCL